MNLEELRQNLQRLDIPERHYSLNGDLKIDAIILYPNYAKWEVFYMDERYGRHDEKVFSSESEACEYILKKIQKLLETGKKFGVRMI